MFYNGRLRSLILISASGSSELNTMRLSVVMGSIVEHLSQMFMGGHQGRTRAEHKFGGREFVYTQAPRHADSRPSIERAVTP